MTLHFSYRPSTSDSMEVSWRIVAFLASVIPHNSEINTGLRNRPPGPFQRASESVPAFGGMF